MKSNNIQFSNRNAVIATMHGKESVIAPLMERALDIKCNVPLTIDTDSLGTFSGEIDREDHPLTTARKKCLLAMDLTGCDMVISSEGSFGNHPSLFFTQADDEIVLFVDRKNGVEIVGRKLSTDTNFGGTQINSRSEATGFAESVGFPEHGLIVRDTKDSSEDIEKGIVDVDRFERVVNEKLKKNGTAWIETDMRAFVNPTRMKVIEEATENLIAKIKSECPSCQFPGYWVTDLISGLPCSYCGSPTESTLAHYYSCQKCEFNEQVKFPKGKIEEDPTYCNICNP